MQAFFPEHTDFQMALSLDLPTQDASADLRQSFVKPHFFVHGTTQANVGSTLRSRGRHRLAPGAQPRHTRAPEAPEGFPECHLRHDAQRRRLTGSPLALLV